MIFTNDAAEAPRGARAGGNKRDLEIVRTGKYEKVDQRLIDKAMEEPEDDAPPPEDLGDQIRERITDKPEAWDDALWDIVQEQLQEEDDEDA